MIAALFFAAALEFTPADADLAYDTAATLVEKHTPRDAGTICGRNAALFIFDKVGALGLDAKIDSFVVATPLGARRLNNVQSDIVSDPSAPWIVLVSHYDTKSGARCPGANDGASTSGLLVALAGRIRESRAKGFNVRFVWTDGEECMKEYSGGDGLWGSKRAAAKLAEEKLDVKAVVCLDMLGDADLSISVPRNGADSLKSFVLAAARKVGARDKVRLGKAPVIDDHVPFLEQGFPAVDLIDFDFGSVPGRNDWWHSPDDSMDKVSRDSLLLSGRLVLAFVESIALGQSNL